MNYTLITGGTEGIGLEIAKLFARDNHNLIIVARNEAKLLEIKKDIELKFSIKVIILSVDLSEENGSTQVIDFVRKNNFYVDNLINNAGIGSFGEFVEAKEGFEKKIINLNIVSLTDLTKYFLKIMKQRKEGNVLNISSTAAFVAGPGMAMYYSTKAYVLSLTEALHEETKKYGVYVGCLCPGPVKTQFQTKAGIVKDKSADKYLMEPKKVGKIAYRGILAKKAIIVPGVINKLVLIGSRFVSKSVSRRVIFKKNVI